jgi:hypothetical protein
VDDIIQRTMTVITTLTLNTTKAMGGKGSDLTTTVMATMWFTKCQAKTEADSNLKGGVIQILLKKQLEGNLWKTHSLLSSIDFLSWLGLSVCPMTFGDRK